MAMFNNSSSLILQRQFNEMVKQRDLIISRAEAAIKRAENRLHKYKAEIKNNPAPVIKVRLEAKRDETKRQLVDLKQVIKDFD